MSYCNKCGAEMEAQSNFCSACGNKVDDQINSQQEGYQGYQPSEQPVNLNKQQEQPSHQSQNQMSSQPRPPYQGGMPQYQSRGAQPPRTNPLAIAGFVVSCASLLLCCFGIVGIVGVVLSAIGLMQISSSNESGKGLAIAGIAVGSFGTLIAFIFILATMLG